MVTKIKKKEEANEVKEEKDKVVEDTGVYEFLAGYKDENGEVHKEFEIRDMDGEVEEAIGSNKVRRNGGKVIKTLLSHCITRIGEYKRSDMKEENWEGIIDSLYVGDQDYALLQIRKESLGSEMELVHKCDNPRCQEENRIFVETDELGIDEFNGNHTIEFELPKGYRHNGGEVRKKGIMRRPKGVDRIKLMPTARKNIGKANTLMLTRCLEELGGKPVYGSMLKKMKTRDRKYLLDKQEKESFGVDLTTEVMCVHCGNEFTAQLNPVNFL